MGFCGKCGFKLDGGIAFCPKCGASTGASHASKARAEEPRQKAEANRCPQCGEPLPAFTLRCPTCGFEPREKKPLSSISDLSRRLDEIEADRPKYKVYKKKKDQHEANLVVSPVDQRKVTLIQSFPIPSSKEDLVEFVLLSSTNVNPKAFAETANASASERALSRAWYSKMCQAYEKSQLVLKDDPDFASLRTRCEATIKAVEKNEKKTDGRLVAIICIVIGLSLIALFVYSGISSASRSAYVNSLSPEERLAYDIEEEEKDCKSDESSVRYSVENGKFETARNKVYTIDFDKDLSEERHEYWENRKTELLKMIDDAQADSDSRGVTSNAK